MAMTTHQITYKGFSYKQKQICSFEIDFIDPTAIFVSNNATTDTQKLSKTPKTKTHDILDNFLTKPPPIYQRKIV